MLVPQINQELVAETIEHETVIVNLENGNYYSLVGVGSEIWNALAAGQTSDEILARLYLQYDAPPQVINTSIQDLLNALAEEGLVTFEPHAAETPTQPAASTGDAAPPQPKSAFQAPRLSKFTDMQELLLLDPVHDVDESGWPSGKTDKA